MRLGERLKRWKARQNKSNLNHRETVPVPNESRGNLLAGISKQIRILKAGQRELENSVSTLRRDVNRLDKRYYRDTPSRITDLLDQLEKGEAKHAGTART